MRVREPDKNPRRHVGLLSSAIEDYMEEAVSGVNTFDRA